MENTDRDDLRKWIAEMSIILRKQPTVIKEYDEILVRRLIDKVMVFKDRIEVVFRTGVMVEVENLKYSLIASSQDHIGSQRAN